MDICNVIYIWVCNSILPETLQFFGVLKVIHEEIKQFRQTRHPKIYMGLGKMKNEDSRGIRRLYRGRNYVPKFQDILLCRKLAKQHWKPIEAPSHTTGGARRPRSKQLKRLVYARGARHLILEGSCTRRVLRGARRRVSREKTHLSWLFRPWKPMLGGNFPYKYRLTHSKFLVQNWRSSKERRF